LPQNDECLLTALDIGPKTGDWLDKQAMDGNAEEGQNEQT
jgi:hypothetical protein